MAVATEPYSSEAAKLRTRNKLNAKERWIIHDARNADAKRFETDHFNYFRMSRARFDHLLSLVGQSISHGGNHRIPIAPTERLAVTLLDKWLGFILLLN